DPAMAAFPYGAGRGVASRGRGPRLARARRAGRPPRPAVAPAVLLPGRQGPRPLRLGAGAPRPRRVPARLHAQPVPVQPRSPDGERPLVRVPVSPALLRAVLAGGLARALSAGGRG